MPDEPAAAFLDVRRADDFQRLHPLCAVNIPLEELAGRIHELPPPHTPVDLFDEDESRTKAAAAMLAERGRAIGRLHGAAIMTQGPTATGPGTVRLWRPHALLVKATELIDGEASTNRTALDLACGSGRDAVWLAMAGWRVHAWDKLPDALEKCSDLAARNGVGVTTCCVDLEAGFAMTPQSFDLVCCFNYLHRPLFARIVEWVTPGGHLVYETFARAQRELFGKPASDDHLLEPGELAAWFPDWQILISHEGHSGPRRYTSGLVAQRPRA